MNPLLKDYCKIGFNHHMFFPCKDNPELHVKTLPVLLNHKEIEAVDLTIPYGSPYREQAVEQIRKSGKTVIYNGYLMPTPKIPLSTLSHTERSQILMLAKDQVDVAYEAGIKLFMQSVGEDPGKEKRAQAFSALGLYMKEICGYMKEKGDMEFVIELMDRNMDKKSLCGPSEEVVDFLDGLSQSVPNIGVVLDLNHVVLMQESFQKVFHTCKKYLKHVHLGNCILKDTKHPWWGGMHPPVGIPGGEIDVPQLTEVLRILLEIGYLNKEKRGTLCFEVKTFPEMTVEETIEHQLGKINKAWECI